MGIISTARITHATPAGAYAHVAERDWEAYDSVKFGADQTQQGCTDIAFQLISRSTPIDLLFGGGRRFFFTNSTPDVANSTAFGSRTDGRSLVKDSWKGRYIWNHTELKKITPGSPEPILGLFSYDHMMYETDRVAMNSDEPSLSEMTQFAIKHFLSSNQGFFLLVEGGRIDHGHHETKARYALDEFALFDDAIGEARELLKSSGVLDETLLVVTADHSHVFTMGAYSSRGSNVLGFGSLEQYNVSDVDRMRVNIIAYGNGPNFPAPRNNTYLDALNTNATSYLSPAALPLKSETHGGEDVPVYAQGPWSHLFIGTMEQHTIAHKMAYAACWGDYQTRSGCPSSKNGAQSTGTRSSLLSVFFSMILSILSIVHSLRLANNESI